MFFIRGAHYGAAMDGDPALLVHVVDGDPAVRDSLTTLLDLNGFAVSTYATGGAFLDYLAHNEGSGSCAQQWVVCEADLPDGSGIEVFGRMREAKLPAPFILLVSRRKMTTKMIAAKALANVRRQGFRLGWFQPSDWKRLQRPW